MAKKLEDEEVKILLDEDCCQPQEGLADSLEVIQTVISINAAYYI